MSVIVASPACDGAGVAQRTDVLAACGDVFDVFEEVVLGVFVVFGHGVFGRVAPAGQGAVIVQGAAVLVARGDVFDVCELLWDLDLSVARFAPAGHGARRIEGAGVVATCGDGGDGS